MKKTLFTLPLLVASVAAFAQGRVNLINDAASPVVLTTDTTKVLAQDVGQAGTSVGDASPLLSGIVLAAGLYGGPTSSTLYLYSVTMLNNAAIPGGSIPATTMVLNANPGTGSPAIPGITSGTPITPTGTPWFEVKVWNDAYATYDLALAAQSYVGVGALFQMNPSSSAIAKTGTTPPGPNSTWVEGPIVVALATIPEPGTMALAGLGAAALLIFRRRK